MKKPATRRWLSMGVELEGSYTRGIPADIAAAVKGAQAKRDGSIRELRGHVSEIVTRVHNSLDPLCDDVTALYPDLVNWSCGLHIHAAFKMLDHGHLTEPAFLAYFLERWEAWGNKHKDEMGPIGEYFWMRLNNRKIPGTERNYCSTENKAVIQLTDSNSAHRYTALNFSAWHKYKTVECRLLPMFNTAALAVSAIRELSDIYDDFLTNTEFPKVNLYTEFKEQDGKLIEEKVKKMPSLELQEWKVVGKMPSAPIITEDTFFTHEEVQGKYFLDPRNPNKRLGEEL